MHDEFDRLDLTDLTAQQLAPLEGLMTPDWPETWRDLAVSLYVTLLSLPGSRCVALEHLARLVVLQTQGIAQDIGGTQPYIPVGASLVNSGRARRVVELLGRGLPYKAVADATGLTANHVRRIQRIWRREQRALRQQQLPWD